MSLRGLSSFTSLFSLHGSAKSGFVVLLMFEVFLKTELFFYALSLTAQFIIWSVQCTK